MIENTQLPQSDNSKELFILKQSQKFNLDCQYQKILGFSPMLANTCVVLAIKSHCVQCVAHINQQGKILKEILFTDSNFYPFIITSDHQIVWLDTERNVVLQWNLQTYELLQFPFEYLNESVSGSHQIFLFPETRLFCIAERGRHDNNIFRLTYFYYPLSFESTPVHCFQSDQVWTYEYQLKRGNMSSMLIWFKKPIEHIELRIFELEGGGGHEYEGKYRAHKIVNTLCKSEIIVGNVWQMSPHKYLLVTIISQFINNPSNSINPLLIYESDTNLLRQANFTLDREYFFKLVDYCSFGNTSMIRTFKFNQRLAQESPIYFIDNQNECISARDTWICSNRNKYTFPAYDPNMIIDAEYENGDVKQITSHKVRVVCPRQIAVEMLIELIEEPCQDLLADVATLLYGFN